MRQYMVTAHLQLVGYDAAGALVQLKYDGGFQNRLVELPQSYETVIASGPLKGFCMLRSGENSVSFVRDGLFLCAEPSRIELVHNRSEIGLWEKFLKVEEHHIHKMALLANFNVSGAREIARFGEAVSWHIAHQKAVKIYAGCGPVPRPGFLNLDVTVDAPGFAVQNPDQYFIFRFADGPWGLPDNCVDYIFHEDFIEHISQLQQIQFLAEAFRVLKPGQYHRVNTPNLITTMRNNSDFNKGFEGVYTGELQWGHVSLFTPTSLKEMAELVGYREVVFTKKHHGVSAFAENDSRPWADRDDVVGNIYADLRK